MKQTNEHNKRRAEFQRNAQLENLLQELNALLGPVEEQIIQPFENEEPEVWFIVGVPRSGTTLLLQWLAVSGQFAYVSNFVSRFYNAPALGFKLQKLLFDPQYQYSDELALPDVLRQAISFESRLGKTSGLLSPNEFWYFWRRFFTPADHTDQLNAEQLNQVDVKRFKQELAAMNHEAGRPLVLKAMNMNWNIPFLAQILPAARFLFVHRDPLANMASLLKAREKFYGSREMWYSFKPPAYPQLQKMDAYHQVAGQVYFTLQGIEQGLAQLNEERYLRIQYEDFCQNPAAVWQTLAQQFRLKLPSYSGPQRFVSGNEAHYAHKEEMVQLRRAASHFFDKTFEPLKEVV